MDTFPKRLKHALTVRKVSQYRMARELGVRDADVSNLVRAQKGRGANPSYALVRAISRIVNVDPDWLGLGEGHAPSEDLTIDAKYPNRARACAIARAGGISEAVVSRVENEAYDLAEDPPVLQWIRWIEATAQLAQTTPPPATHIRVKGSGEAAPETPAKTRRSPGSRG